MHEPRYGVEILMKTDGECGEDCGAIIIGMAVESLFDVLEARLHRDTAAWKECQLRRVTSEPFQRGQTIDRGQLADCIHASMKVKRRQTRTTLADLGNAQPHFGPYLCERVSSHHLPPVERRLSQIG